MYGHSGAKFLSLVAETKEARSILDIIYQVHTEAPGIGSFGSAASSPT